tara:strand:- start:4 stop:912 length:909 start_codon:yes stop_codon:yes gene_type:complete
MSYKKIILLFGPTASGKSKLALDIARKFNGEIINADSMQIYKEIKVLSARPDNKNIKHHFYGFISVKRNFSVGLWHKLVAAQIKKINKTNKTAIVVGGTGLYFKVLTEGISEIPLVPKLDLNLNLKDRINLINNYNYKYPEIFKGISASDSQRLYRAISVYENTGMALHKWYEKKNKKKYFKSEEFTKIYLKPAKAALENRIKRRFDKMIKNGAIKEAKNFNRLNIDPTLSSNFIIGLKEISEFLSKKITMKELKEKVLIRSRQYAKRQFTWQRGQMKDWKGFDDINYLDLRKKVISYLSKT